MLLGNAVALGSDSHSAVISLHDPSRPISLSALVSFPPEDGAGSTNEFLLRVSEALTAGV